MAIHELIQQQHKFPEILRARVWYETLCSGVFKRYGTRGPEVLVAYALSQDQGFSPSAGMRLVRKALSGKASVTPMRATESDSVKELAVYLDKQTFPDRGLSPLFYDTVDVLFKMSTRKLFGNDPEMGRPVPVDIWGFRDVGLVDGGLKEFLLENAHPNSVDHVRALELDELGRDQYEYAARFYQDVAQKLSDRRWLGEEWLPHQALAIGRYGMQLKMKQKPNWSEDLLKLLDGC